MLKHVGKIVGGVVLVFAIIGGFLSLDSYLKTTYVLRVYHDACMAEVTGTIQQIQVDQQRTSIRHDLLFWIKMEHEYELLLIKDPSNALFLRRYNEAKKNRVDAEQALNELERGIR